MYPRLSDVFVDLFGFTFPIPIYSFGAMVAAGVLVGMWLTRIELDRIYSEGRISGVRMPVKDARGKRKTATREVSPSLLMGTVTVLAVGLGIAGAKLFYVLENFQEFRLDPFGTILSTGGLIFYGGLITAALGVAYYLRRKRVEIAPFYDAIAPGLMIAYGIGRLGCHLAGDGDWGIAADMSARPGWIPTWLWAETYPNNILGVTLAEPGVYPTSVYEFLFAGLLFGVLWVLRKHPYKSGWLFSFYLVLNGIERFLIEKIRVNPTYDLLGLSVSQAEAISTVIIAAGVAGLVATWKYRGEALPGEASRVEAIPTSA